jgi:hypothetical protein
MAIHYALFENRLTPDPNDYTAVIQAGDSLAEMPLFLEPTARVPVPLEATYQRAFAALPRRWRTVLERQD